MCGTMSFRSCLLASILLVCYTSAAPSKSFESVHNTNAAILNRLGLTPVEISDGHHKKRLAGPEPPGLQQSRLHQPYSRRHGHRDSHVYVVKLPAMPPYYTLTKPHKSSPKDDKMASKGQNVVVSGVSPSVGFHSNGKPGKIYHWNLPLVKKIGEKKRLHAQMKMEQARKKFEVEKIGVPRQSPNSINSPMKLMKKDGDVQRFISSNALTDKATLNKHSRNNDKILNYPEESRRISTAIDAANGTQKMFRLEDSMLYNIAPNQRLASWGLPNDFNGMKLANLQKPKKHRKKAAMSYYAPITSKTGSTTSIHKNFPGNGKPKAFYVMEKSRKPVYYHPLLP